MVDTGYIVATNKIILAGHVQSVEMGIEDATNMYAGRLVMHGTTNNDVLVNDGAEIAYGWLGYEQSPIMYRPASLTTLYAINARAAILHGPGMIIVGRRKASETIVMGDKMEAAAAGEVAKWVPVTDTGDTGAAGKQIVATAVEDGSGAASDIILRSEI
jgi:hypothetical protein